MGDRNEGMIELSVPSSQESMLVVRLTTSGALAKLNFGMDKIDDMKMAVEEACQCIMRYADCERLRIRFESAKNAVVFMLFAEAPKEGGAQLNEHEIAIIRSILQSLVDEVEIDERMHSVRMIKKCTH